MGLLANDRPLLMELFQVIEYIKLFASSFQI